jgi:hypothetical protein
MELGIEMNEQIYSYYKELTHVIMEAEKSKLYSQQVKDSTEKWCSSSLSKGLRLGELTG